MNGINVDRVKKWVRLDEGLILHVYRCPAGKRTIGYGYNLDANKLPDFIDFYLAEHGEITLEMAEWLMDRKLSEAVDAAKAILGGSTWDWLTEPRREVIVQMIYNMGEGTFRKFKGTIKSITEHDIPGAVMGLKSSLWHRQLPARSGRLIKEFEKG